jgi:hypothetical protein
LYVSDLVQESKFVRLRQDSAFAGDGVLTVAMLDRILHRSSSASPAKASDLRTRRNEALAMMAFH